MKKDVIGAGLMVLLACTVLAGSLLLGGCTSTAPSVSGGNSQTGIWVSGTGKTTAVPDVAVLQLGVEARASTVKQAQSDAAAAMNSVMDALSANGVASKDIQTLVFSIAPVTKWVQDTNEQITVGYVVTNTVTAKVGDTGQVGTVVDAVAAAGGNMTRVQGISFKVDDPTPYYSTARVKAVADAQAKAKQMAALGNVTLGKLTYMSESSYLPSSAPVAYMADKAGGATPISPGETEITITVQMAFDIR